MKVLVFGWEFPPQVSGGLGVACHGLIAALARQGVKITLVLPKAQGLPTDCPVDLLPASRVDLASVTRRNLRRVLSRATVQLVEVDSLLQPYLTPAGYAQRLVQVRRERPVPVETTHPEEVTEVVPAGQFLEFSGHYGPDLLQEVSRYAVVGARLGKQRRFDLIHCHDWMTYLAGVEAKQQSGRPLIAHVHATEFDRSGDRPNSDIYRIERYGLECADLVIAVSHRTRDTLLQRYGLPPAKVAVVHNAVSKETLVRREEVRRHLKEKIVLFLGRVTQQKGPEYFVSAAAKVLEELRARGLTARFVMAGSGDLLPEMIERVAALRLHQHFHFTGFLRGRELETMFAMSDLYVMPSVSEPFGITPFEAILHGVPTIVSRQSGITEVLRHVIKVDFWDVDELARQILRVLTDEAFARQLAADSYRELAAVSWDKAATQVRELYATLRQ